MMIIRLLSFKFNQPFHIKIYPTGAENATNEDTTGADSDSVKQQQ